MSAMGGKQTFAADPDSVQTMEKMVEAEAIERLIRSLAEHPTVREQNLRFNAATDATLSKVNPGILIWTWKGPLQGRRGKAPLAYYDHDGQIVTVGLLAIDDEVVEIELQRGDSTPVLSTPSRSDLWDVVPGTVYSPRS